MQNISIHLKDIFSFWARLFFLVCTITIVTEKAGFGRFYGDPLMILTVSLEISLLFTLFKSYRWGKEYQENEIKNKSVILFFDKWARIFLTLGIISIVTEKILGSSTVHIDLKHFLLSLAITAAVWITHKYQSQG